MTHSQSAPTTVSKDLETSRSTPIRAQPPIRVPITISRVGQLTRRGSASVGSSTWAASAARCRRSGSSPGLAGHASPERGDERRAVQLAEGTAHDRLRQGAGSGVSRALGADQDRRRGHRPGYVPVELLVRRVGRGVAEPGHDDGARCPVGQQRVPAERAVRDPRSAQAQQLAVQVIEGGVADVGVGGVGQRGPAGQAAHDQRVLGRSRDLRLDQFGDVDARAARPQHEVSLMLDLLEPGERERRPGIPVEDEAARLGQQLGVGGIAAVDVDAQLTAGRPIRAGLGRPVLSHPPDLPGRQSQLAGADAQLPQQQPDLIDRRQAERRAEHEPDHRRRAPADGQAARDVDRQPVAAHRGRERHQDDEGFDQPLHAPGQVRERRRGHRHEQRDPQHREAQQIAADLDPGRPAAGHRATPPGFRSRRRPRPRSARCPGRPPSGARSARRPRPRISRRASRLRRPP